MVYALAVGFHVYAAKYHDVKHPKVKCFRNESSEQATSNPNKKSGAKIILTDEDQFAIGLAVVENSELSVNDISRGVKISKSKFTRK